MIWPPSIQAYKMSMKKSLSAVKKDYTDVKVANLPRILFVTPIKFPTEHSKNVS